MNPEPALATGHPPTVKPHCFELWLLAGRSLSIKRALHMSGAGVTFTLKILILLWPGSRLGLVAQGTFATG
jgi:hypothetical protein